MKKLWLEKKHNKMFLMSLHVQRQVITSRKLPRAEMALEWLGPGVFPIVTRQFVGPGKLPAAALPWTFVRLLPSVCSLMSFQVGTLGVDFVAGWKITAVDLPSLEAVVELGARRWRCRRCRRCRQHRLCRRHHLVLLPSVGGHQRERSDQLRGQQVRLLQLEPILKSDDPAKPVQAEQVLRRRLPANVAARRGRWRAFHAQVHNHRVVVVVVVVEKGVVVLQRHHDRGWLGLRRLDTEINRLHLNRDVSSGLRPRTERDGFSFSGSGSVGRRFRMKDRSDRDGRMREWRRTDERMVKIHLGWSGGCRLRNEIRETAATPERGSQRNQTARYGTKVFFVFWRFQSIQRVQKKINLKVFSGLSEKKLDFLLASSFHPDWRWGDQKTSVCVRARVRVCVCVCVWLSVCVRGWVGAGLSVLRQSELWVDAPTPLHSPSLFLSLTLAFTQKWSQCSESYSLPTITTVDSQSHWFLFWKRALVKTKSIPAANLGQSLDR